MALKTKLNCFWTLGLYLRTVVASSSSGLPSNTDPFFVNQCVEIHNQCRGKVNPPAANMKHMSWDATLAKAAKAWANKCKFHHSICSRRPEVCHQGFSSIGENIWLGSLSAFSPKAAITSWYNETAFYNFDTKSCSKICGHYTQVVWATSYKVGCGNALCPNLGGHGDVLFVCNYGPAGNFREQLPYIKGEPCSMCSEEEKCMKNLCKETEVNSTGKAPQRIGYNILSLGFVLLRIL